MSVCTLSTGGVVATWVACAAAGAGAGTNVFAYWPTLWTTTDAARATATTQLPSSGPSPTLGFGRAKLTTAAVMRPSGPAQQRLAGTRPPQQP